MINTRVSTVLGALIGLAALTVPAIPAEVATAPDPAASREFSAKLNVCGACHGLNGVPVRPGIPVIWGQQENYLLKQIHDFDGGAREFEVMKWMAETLTPAEQAASATFFSKKVWPTRSATQAAATQPPAGMAVCQACHQTDFRGAPQAEGMPTPRLAGQTYEYLVEAMRRYAEGQRKNSDVMQKIMEGITPAQREAMARYLAGL